MLVASDDATDGSVIAKADLISPASKGSSHCFLCSSEPYLSNTSILPVSGALQLKDSDANRLRPMISAKCAYSRLEIPAPP